jgi:lysophospholipase L1-like esterase
MNLRNAIISAILFVVACVIAVGGAEGVLRLKNSSMTNYDIEMWRYSKELKVRSPDPALDFVHVKNSSALLQSVTIRTNAWGLRGENIPPRDPNVRRILFLGGSITLGWGVKEDDTVTEQLSAMFAKKGSKVEVLNGGIGNYNAERYVERFFTDLQGLDPSDIVVQYFLRDAEHLDPGGGNFFLRNSELAVTLWIAANRLSGKLGEKSLEDHYRAAYQEDQRGYRVMLSSLKKLADYAKANHIRLYLAMTPDVHNLGNYPFGYIHERMRGVAEADGYTFVDLLPAFGKLSPDQVWAMPGDPHPNALGHHLMAEAIFPVLGTGAAKAQLGQ